MAIFRVNNMLEMSLHLPDYEKSQDIQKPEHKEETDRKSHALTIQPSA